MKTGTQLQLPMPPPGPVRKSRPKKQSLIHKGGAGGVRECHKALTERKTQVGNFNYEFTGIPIPTQMVVKKIYHFGYFLFSFISIRSSRL